MKVVVEPFMVSELPETKVGVISPFVLKVISLVTSPLPNLQADKSALNCSKWVWATAFSMLVPINLSRGSLNHSSEAFVTVKDGVVVA